MYVALDKVANHCTNHYLQYLNKVDLVVFDYQPNFFLTRILYNRLM